MPQDTSKPSSPSFIFINYSDPTHDCKNKKNKHLVTKHATIHACRTRRRKIASTVSSILSPPIIDHDMRDHDVYAPASSRSPSTTSLLSRDSSYPFDTSHSSDVEDEDTQELVRIDTASDDEVPLALYTLLSCANIDPFGILPVNPDHQIWKLLTSWLNAGAQVDAAQDGYRMQVAAIRKSWFWPMVNRNKATFNAAVAWIALSTNDKSMETAMGVSLANAMPALRESLSQGEAENTAESAWYSIILLCAIAIRTGNTNAVYAHYRGLASLLSRKPDLVTSPEHTTIPFTSSFLYTFVAAVILTNYDSYRQEPSLSYLPHFVLSTGPELSRSLNEQGISSGFSALYEAGELSSFLFSTFNQIKPLQPLFAKARRNELSTDDAAAMINAIWCCTTGMYIPKPITTENEELIWMASLLYWHVERKSWNAVDDLAPALARRLDDIDFVALVSPGRGTNSKGPAGLYNECSLWLNVSAGAHVKSSDAKQRLGGTVRWLASDVLKLKTWHEIHTTLCKFFWTDIADQSAIEFLQTWCSGKTPRLPRMSHQSVPGPGFWDVRDSFSTSAGPFATQSPSSFDGRAIPVDEALPCQFCRKIVCICKEGKADIGSCPDHLRGSLWAVPPSIFGTFCRPVWVPHNSRELPRKWEVKEMERNWRD